MEDILLEKQGYARMNKRTESFTGGTRITYIGGHYVYTKSREFTTSYGDVY